MLEGLMRFLGITPKEDNYTVITRPDGNSYIMDGNREIAGPYSRAADAKGQLTRMKNSYTPGARRPNATSTDAVR